MLEFIVGVSVGLIVGFVFGLIQYTPIELICNRWIHRNDLLPMAFGCNLDGLGMDYNVKRRKYLWVFKESDWSYRRRCLEVMRRVGQ